MLFNFKIGLKLYSTDASLISQASKLKNHFFDFIELYIVPGTHKRTIREWMGLKVSYIIHMPHSSHGVNLAQADKWENNLKHFMETRMFADDLGSEFIIVHGGSNGSIEETVRQLTLLEEKRILLENKPKIGIRNTICVGWSCDEFHYAMNKGPLCGMALDFGHAVCTAHTLRVNEIEIINKFMMFNPRVFHLSDGNAFSEIDSHLNLGKGCLKLVEFLRVVPAGGLVTIETPRDRSKGLRDHCDDVTYLFRILSEDGGFL